MIDVSYDGVCTNKINKYHDQLPSGKRLHNHGKSPFFIGKSTISMAMFNSYVAVCQNQ